MARGARLLITVGRVGVRSVRSKNKVTSGNQRKWNAVSFGDDIVYHVIVKKRGSIQYLYPHGAPERPELKVFGLGCFTGASVD